MDSFNFHDIRAEKASAVSRYRRIQRIKALFRFVELFVFLIIVSRISVDRFDLPLKLSVEYFQRISVSLISPRFVFLIGNAIVIFLPLKSGRFSAANGAGIDDLYEEYVEKCRRNQEGKGLGACGYGVCYEDRRMYRSNSEKIERMKHRVVDRRREMRRSLTERCQRSPECERKMSAADELSSEEFRRPVEAFIARQQRFLRESN